MTGTHPVGEDFPWEIAVVDHPPRAETALYRRSRTLMNTLAKEAADGFYGAGPFEDHHGGGLWVLDDVGWMCVQLPLGIEWSAQFCADPAKVDKLRLFAQRILAAFPKTLPGYAKHKYTDAERILASPITTAAHVSRWTDSIFNASVPLPRSAHTGVLPSAAGYHHYPKPIVDIDHIRYDDYQLFVRDAAGLPAAVVPAAAWPSRTVRVIAAHPQSEYAGRLLDAQRRPDRVVPLPRTPDLAEREALGPARAASPEATDPTLLDAADPLSRQAFARADDAGRRPSPRRTPR